MKIAEYKQLIKPKESHIQTEIINYLRSNNYYVQRLNSGMIPTAKGGMIKLAAKGTPDLMAFKWCGMRHHMSTSETVLLFVEVKVPGKNPTPTQKMMMEDLEKFGAKCIVAHSVEELERLI